jgi:hypothetical protein
LKIFPGLRIEGSLVYLDPNPTILGKTKNQATLISNMHGMA